MNIGIFSDCYLPTRNGVSTVIAEERAGLVRRGHRVSLFTVAMPGSELEDTLGPAYRFPSVPFNRQIQLRIGMPSQGSIDRLVVRDHIDIIHTHTEFTLGRAGQLAAAAAGLPVVHTLHTLYPAYRHYLPLGHFVPPHVVDALVGRFLQRCNGVVCPSEKGRAYALACAPQARVTVIPNGLAPGRFWPSEASGAARARGRAALGIEEGARVALYAGRLAPEKRVLDLLHALRPLLASDPQCRAVFLGAGPQRSGLAATAGRFGVRDQVILAGPVPWEAMPESYAAADVFVTASLSEVHPMTVIEAIASGLPVIARRDPSTCDLVLDGVNGYLVDSDADITTRLATLLDDDGTRRAFGRRAAALAECHTIETHVDRLEALYRHAIETHRGKVVQ